MAVIPKTIFLFLLCGISHAFHTSPSKLTFHHHHQRVSTSVTTVPIYGAERNGRTAQLAKKDEEEVITVRKTQLVDKIAEATGMTKKDSDVALMAVLNTIAEEVSANNRVNVQGFGTFKLSYRKARKGRNPQTGEELDIPASYSPTFTSAKAFKERCNESMGSSKKPAKKAAKKPAKKAVKKKAVKKVVKRVVKKAAK